MVLRKKNSFVAIVVVVLVMLLRKKNIFVVVVIVVMALVMPLRKKKL